MTMASINERVGDNNCVDPVLRWQSGNAVATICVASGLSPCDDELDCEIGYSDPFGVWGDDGNPDMLDVPISDEDWERLLKCVGIC